jgi:hypothetical protein
MNARARGTSLGSVVSRSAIATANARARVRVDVRPRPGSPPCRASSGRGDESRGLRTEQDDDTAELRYLLRERRLQISRRERSDLERDAELPIEGNDLVLECRPSSIHVRGTRQDADRDRVTRAVDAFRNRPLSPDCPRGRVELRRCGTQPLDETFELLALPAEQFPDCRDERVITPNPNRTSRAGADTLDDTGCDQSGDRLGDPGQTELRGRRQFGRGQRGLGSRELPQDPDIRFGSENAVERGAERALGSRRGTHERVAVR